MRKHLIILGIISVIAFLIRIQVCHELAAVDPQVANPSSVTDMHTYKELASKIMKGKFNQVFYYQPFYYTIFLPTVKFCFGNGINAVIFVQCLLSAFTVFLAALSATYIKNRTAGVITATLLTFSTIMILFTPYYLIATLQAFWITLILFLSLITIRKVANNANCTPSSFYRWTILLGLTVGLAILTRGNIWIFVPGIVVMLTLIAPTKAKTKNILIALTLFIIATVLPQLPFAIHNTHITEKLTGPSTAAGAVLALGNTPEAPPGGRDPGTHAGPMEYPETCKYWTKNAKAIPVYKQIIKWSMREPLPFLELQFRKMLLFWDYREIPNNIAIETQGVKSKTLRIVGLLPVEEVAKPNGPRLIYNLVPMSLIVLVLGLAGTLFTVIRLLSDRNRKIIARLKHHLCEYILAYFIISYWLGTAAFYILGRFRVPIIPLFAIAGSIFLYGFYSFIKRFRQHSTCELRNKTSKRVVITNALILLISLYIVILGNTIYRNVLESKVLAEIRPHGIIEKIAPHTLMIRDNGPQSFGAWTPFELKKGQVIDKIFANFADKPLDVPIRFKLNIFWLQPGSAEIEVNGKNVTISSKKIGLQKHTFTLKSFINNVVTIRPIKLNAQLFLFIDQQRDYKRTKINGNDPKGELVSAIYINEK